MTGKEKAEKILVLMLEDPEFMHPGRRNDDTVNMLICCRILGLDHMDVATKIDGMDNFEAFCDKAEIVENYLDTWCPNGNEEQGLDYLCETHYTKEVM